jgi:3-oxoacyl-[acyl-carrier protein] reductase
MDLQGKAAIVTGGGVGTGRAVVLDLARRGCDVAVNYSRSKTEAEQTAHDASELGVRVVCIQADVRDDAAVRSMTEEVGAVFGRLDVLVNNAGVTRHIDHADLEGADDEAWSFIFETNVRGTFSCTRAATPRLREDGGGAIVNLSSVAGVYAIGSSIPYCASKAAINNMTVSLARALAPAIRVNAVAPGFIDTRWWSEREHYEAIKELAAAAAPLGAVCTPEDVSKVVVDLATSDLVTGQIVVVDGGMGIRG